MKGKARKPEAGSSRRKAESKKAGKRGSEKARKLKVESPRQEAEREHDHSSKGRRPP